MPTFPPNNLNSLVKGVVADIGGEALFGSRSASSSQVQAGPSQYGYLDNGNTFIRSSHQASRIFAIDGPGAARPRGLFYIVFRRAGVVEEWQRDIGFLVKALDQPRVQPKTEELNQYNKKRQIYTGYDLAPVSVTVYDTADSAVTQMWSQYTKFFFGDFNQVEDNFRFDQLHTEMLGDDVGYGLVLPETSEAEEENSQFFFTSIDIYKVWANEYTKTTLVNPRISSFDPDDLDYAQMEALTYRMTFEYEAVLYENDGAPMPIEADEALMDIFGDPRGDADMIEVEGPFRHSTAGPSGGGTLGNLNDLMSFAGSDFLPIEGGSQRSGSGGVLGAFGSFDFGSLAGEAINRVVSGRGLSGAGAELAYAATGNPTLSTIIGMATSPGQRGALLSQGLTTMGSKIGISPALVDGANALIAAKSGNSMAAGKLAGQLAAGVLGGASLSGKAVTQQVAKTAGLKLGQAAMNVVNSQRSKTSQLGFKLPNPFKKI